MFLRAGHFFLHSKAVTKTDAPAQPFLTTNDEALLVVLQAGNSNFLLLRRPGFIKI
jgi:hypothetical protein